MRRLSLRVVVVVTAAVLSAACGVPVDPQQENQPGQGGTFGDDRFLRRPINPEYFENPLARNGVVVSASDDTVSRLPFSPLIPTDDIGEPRRIEVTLPGTSPTDANVAWVYESSEFGRFVLHERVTVGGEAGQDLLEEPSTHTPGCTTRPLTEEEQAELGPSVEGERTTCHSGNSEVVVIRDGVRAVLVDGPFETNFMWHQPLKERVKGAYDHVDHPLALEIRLVGPIEDFSSQQALKVAEEL